MPQFGISKQDQIGIFSLNCRGMGNKDKRRQVFHFHRKKSSSILFLQETHSTKSFEKYWLSEWGFKILFSHGSSDSRGTCILFKSIFDLEIVKYIADSNERFVIADIIADSKKFTLVNLYAPNEDKPEFFDEIFDTLKEFDCESIIIGSDFNCILNSDVDKQGGRLDSKPNSRARLLSYIENYDLSDIWRNLNPNTRRCTWHSANGKIRCRLDYFLIFSWFCKQC